MEIIKDYKKETEHKEMKLSEYLKHINYKVGDFNDDYTLLNGCDYEGMSDYLTEELTELITKANYITGFELKNLFYSLCNCQGDGVMFECEFYYKGVLVKITHQGNYYHYNSKEINVIDYDETLNDEQTQEYEEEINNIYVYICKELEKKGYNYIQEEDESTLLNINVEHFLNEIGLNAISYDFDLLKAEELADLSNSVEIYKDYYIKNIKVNVKKYTQTTIKEFEEVTY